MNPFEIINAESASFGKDDLSHKDVEAVATDVPNIIAVKMPSGKAYKVWVPNVIALRDGEIDYLVESKDKQWLTVTGKKVETKEANAYFG